MDVFDAIMSRRSVRRFQQKDVSLDVLKKIVDAARVAPSAKNLQPLEYVIVTKKEVCHQVFETLGWAGYLEPTWSPSEEERPSAYIVMLVRKKEGQFYKWDAGLAAAHIMLAAESEGLGSCMLLNVNRAVLSKVLSLPSSVAIDAVIALGYKAEDPVVEPFKESVKYWLDDHGVLHVPKRSLSSIVHMNSYH